MFTDPTSIRLLREGQLLEAEQRRHNRRAIGRPGRTARMRQASTIRIRETLTRGAPTPLHGDLEPFAGLRRNELRRLARHFSVMELDSGNTYARQGELHMDFVVVLDGRIGVSIDGLPLAVLDAGSQFGALPLLDDGPVAIRRASFDVLEPARVAVADRQQFFQILDSFPVVAQRIRATADLRRAYLSGRADGRALAPATEVEPFPVHLADQHLADQR